MQADRDDDSSDEPRRWSLPWWFARLAFSFIVLGAAVGYEGWKAHQRGEATRATIMMLGAAAGIALGMLGVRLRHRR